MSEQRAAIHSPQVLREADLNVRQIRMLDGRRTGAVLQGGIVRFPDRGRPKELASGSSQRVISPTSSSRYS